MKSYKNYLPFYGIYYMWVNLECEREEFMLSLTLHIFVIVCVLALTVC